MILFQVNFTLLAKVLIKLAQNVFFISHSFVSITSVIQHYGSNLVVLNVPRPHYKLTHFGSGVYLSFGRRKYYGELVTFFMV